MSIHVNCINLYIRMPIDWELRKEMTTTPIAHLDVRQFVSRLPRYRSRTLSWLYGRWVVCHFSWRLWCKHMTVCSSLESSSLPPPPFCQSLSPVVSKSLMQKNHFILHCRLHLFVWHGKEEEYFLWMNIYMDMYICLPATSHQQMYICIYIVYIIYIRKVGR